MQVLKITMKILSRLHLVLRDKANYNEKNQNDNSITFNFCPLEPPVEIRYALVWKRYAVFSNAAEAFLQAAKNLHYNGI